MGAATVDEEFTLDQLHKLSKAINDCRKGDDHLVVVRYTSRINAQTQARMANKVASVRISRADQAKSGKEAPECLGAPLQRAN